MVLARAGHRTNDWDVTEPVGCASLDVMTRKLRLSEIALDELAMALDDHGDWTEWWFDPATGDTIPSVDPMVSGIDDDLDLEDKIHIRPQPSRAAYETMVEFADAVADPRTRELLQRALVGKGAFRRFRDTLYDVPELVDRWRGFERLAAEMRALDWLEEADLVDPDELRAAVHDRHGRVAAVLADLGTDHAPRFDRDEVPGRWDEIAAVLDAGTSVTLTRTGAPWCIVSPIDPSGDDRR
jgi:hypothetical protein